MRLVEPEEEMNLKNCLKMEYKDTDLAFIYDLTEGLNLLGKKLNLQGRFIPAVKITATESSFKCFKNIPYHILLKQ